MPNQSKLSSYINSLRLLFKRISNSVKIAKCKIHTVKFHYFMKASKIFFCKILQVKLHQQNLTPKNALYAVRFDGEYHNGRLILIAKQLLKVTLTMVHLVLEYDFSLQRGTTAALKPRLPVE
ncbi:hypothetical protein [Vibrio fluminensis]|uniref:hypothetical protein n=1 Tax=Vibrio fluminensis TaxID=2783614 RepID=UPI0018894221|nr:hypothetical protein [Vibrio fluminensis]